MADVPKIAFAAAVLGGYVLGRTKKGRVAFGMATYLAGRRFGLEPQQLLTEGVKRLRELPQLADLNEQLRGEVLDAGRKAMSAVADRKLADLADSLHQRTERIGSKGKEEPQGEDEEPEDEYEEDEEPEEEGEEAEDEYEEDEEEEPEELEEEEEEPEDEQEQEEEEPEKPSPRRRHAARKPDEGHDGGARRGRERRPERAAARRVPAKKSAPTKKAAAQKTAPAKKTSAARKSSAPPKRTAAKKTAAEKTTAKKASPRRRR
ncbi:histone protein [Streptomyces sp. NPDC002619]|uniref:histone protein n=1 Tax=Streptomyces sp. NPDC002619 TaxID=3364655 RepID=UPI00369C28BF